MSGRTLLVVIEAFFFLTEAYYAAAIVTFLLRPPPNSIRTVHDLVKSNYKGMGHDWIHTRRVLENSTDPLVREVFVRKVQPPRGLGFQTTERVVGALHRPWVVMFGADDVVDEAANTLTSGEACRLVQLDVDTPLFIALGTAKDSAFKEMMHSGTLLQLERGIAYREKRVWRQRRPTCEGGSGDGFAAVEIMPVLPTFVLLAASLLVSAALCLAERAAAAKEKPRRSAGSAFSAVTASTVALASDPEHDTAAEAGQGNSAQPAHTSFEKPSPRSFLKLMEGIRRPASTAQPKRTDAADARRAEGEQTTRPSRGKTAT